MSLRLSGGPERRDLTKNWRLLERLAAELARWAARWPVTSPLKYSSGQRRAVTP